MASFKTPMAAKAVRTADLSVSVPDGSPSHRTAPFPDGSPSHRMASSLGLGVPVTALPPSGFRQGDVDKDTPSMSSHCFEVVLTSFRQHMLAEIDQRILRALSNDRDSQAVGEALTCRGEPGSARVTFSASAVAPVATAKSDANDVLRTLKVAADGHAELGVLREALVESMSMMVELSTKLDRFKAEYTGSLANVVGYVEAVAEAATSSVHLTNRRFEEKFSKLKASVEDRYDARGITSNQSWNEHSETSSTASSMAGEGASPKRTRAASPMKSSSEQDVTCSLKRVLEKVREHNAEMFGEQSPKSVPDVCSTQAAVGQQQQQQQRQKSPLRQIAVRRSPTRGPARECEASDKTRQRSPSPPLPSTLAAVPLAKSIGLNVNDRSVSAIPSTQAKTSMEPQAASLPTPQSALTPPPMSIEQKHLTRSTSMPFGSRPGSPTRRPNLPDSTRARAPFVGGSLEVTGDQTHRSFVSANISPFHTGLKVSSPSQATTTQVQQSWENMFEFHNPKGRSVELPPAELQYQNHPQRVATYRQVSPRRSQNLNGE
eukprot:TRINITY_DN9578_c0_g1_i5.p1 TRINITY_DN9578_c0_g1~~TRINITY_DN9578_c0_g1_i5.p1  ORF type:complete len:546 (-),score=60.78 TRINITY_DN9578_c0_g1_i5:300-1937(-)